MLLLKVFGKKLRLLEETSLINSAGCYLADNNHLGKAALESLAYLLEKIFIINQLPSENGIHRKQTGRSYH